VNFKQATCAVILALGSVLVALPSPGAAAGPDDCVGFSALALPPRPPHPMPRCRHSGSSLDELGYVDGRDVVIETRWRKAARPTPRLGCELVGLRVDILVGVGAVVARAAQELRTTTIPVVMAVVIDPVNLVAERPGGNLTGLTTFDPQEPGRSSHSCRRWCLGWRAWRSSGSSVAGQEGACRQARALGLQPQSLTIAGASPDLEAVFQAIRESTPTRSWSWNCPRR